MISQLREIKLKHILITMFILMSTNMVHADYGSLEILTVPSVESTVYIDNMAIGTTPLKLEKIGAGNHHLEVLLNDKPIYDKEIEVKASSATTIVVRIEREQPSEKVKLYESQGFNSDIVSLYPAKKLLTEEVIDLPVRLKVISAKADAATRETFETESGISAEPYLKSFIQKQKEMTNNVSMLAMGTGALSVIYGNVSGAETNRNAIYYGSVFAGAGLILRFFKPDYETKYEKILDINDSTKSGRAERSSLALSALREASQNAKSARESNGLWLPLFAIYSIASAPIAGIPLTYFAWETMNKKSEAEIAYDTYLKGEEQREVRSGK